MDGWREGGWKDRWKKEGERGKDSWINGLMDE